MAGVYSLKDVAMHNTPEEPWLIIDDKVYNVTKLLPDHPGGETVLLSNAGKNATDAFERKGHSENARRWMRDFQIGVLKGTQAEYDGKKWYESRFLQVGGVFVGLAVTAAAITYAIYKTKHHA